MAEDEDEHADTAERNMRAFVEHCLGFTVNLVRLGVNKLPFSVCSGFLVQRGERVFLLSAGHGIANGPGWGIETKLILQREVVILPLRAVIQLRKPGTPPRSRKKADRIDFAWTEMSLGEIRETMRADPKLKGKTLELPYYRGPLDRAPTKGEAYGFAAWNRVYLGGFSQIVLERDFSYELGMEFKGVDKASGLIKFKLARKHQGQKYYKGASGAPIADPEGAIVSMVLGGDKRDNIIYGLRLARFQAEVGLPPA